MKNCPRAEVTINKRERTRGRLRKTDRQNKRKTERHNKRKTEQERGMEGAKI
jgi:hypothetical protein